MSVQRPSLECSTLNVELTVFLRVCEVVNTPRSLACYLLVKNQEIRQYLDLPMAFQDDDFPDNHLCTQMLRKNPNLPLKHDRRKTARDKWFAAEKQCAETNERLTLYTHGLLQPLNREVNDVIRCAQDFIKRVLGPLTGNQLANIESDMRFGPGVTSAIRGRYATESKKYMANNHVTDRLAPFMEQYYTPGKAVEILNHSTVAFVPKDATTDRAIAIEPHWNSFAQLGIGAALRRKLQRTGIDLDVLADENRAHAGSAIHLNLATIDLASASDTISREVVWLLVPDDWATLMDTARTDYASIEGDVVELQKFSSMGNGFTFELESLIFTALVRAVKRSHYAAFGDDIVIDRKAAPLLIETLAFLGFDCNMKKSFLAGRFFESCGHDFYDGIMIRPFYLKGPSHDFPLSVVRIGNKIRRYAHLRGHSVKCDVRFRDVFDWVSRLDRKASRTFTSLGYSDNAIIRNFDECTPAIARHGHEGYVAHIITEIPVKLDVSESVGALDSVLHRGAAHMAKSVASLRAIHRTAAARQVIPVWYDLGPWG